jgi:N-acyl homoserine lactone hydrolase
LKSTTKKRLAVFVALFVPALLLGRTFMAAPLDAPLPLTAPLPSASPPAEMSVVHLPTGVTHRSAAFAYRGGSFTDHRDFSMSAVLVKHPRGDLLIDTGFGRDIDNHFAKMPMLFRAITSYEKTRSARDQLEATGYDFKRLRGIVLTHAHWDHVSGIPDFPGVPVMVTAEERSFIDTGGALTVVVREMPKVQYEPYAFEGPPYLGFAKSHDVYGDGSIVIVPAGGHTPGSVVVFVTLPNDARYAMVGDLVWQREGITEREERPWLQRTLGDADAAGVRENILRMSAIAAKYPSIVLVPAHDARGFAQMSQH